MLDDTDKRIVRLLDVNPRASAAYLAETLALARGTVHTRLRKLQDGTLLAESTKVPGAAVGRPLRALVTAEVDQAEFDGLLVDVARIPEVVECLAVAGQDDLHLEVVARDPEDLYRVTQALMNCRGIRRTASSIVLRELVGRRMAQLL